MLSKELMSVNDATEFYCQNQNWCCEVRNFWRFLLCMKEYGVRPMSTNRKWSWSYRTPELIDLFQIAMERQISFSPWNPNAFSYSITVSCAGSVCLNQAPQRPKRWTRNVTICQLILLAFALSANTTLLLVIWIADESSKESASTSQKYYKWMVHSGPRSYPSKHIANSILFPLVYKLNSYIQYLMWANLV